MRRSLSAKERRLMAEAQNHACACYCGCTASLGASGAIAEHTWPVALGNTDKPDRLLCKACAGRKTNGKPHTTYGSDSHAIAKTVRLAKGGKVVRHPFPKRTKPHKWPKRRVGQ